MNAAILTHLLHASLHPARVVAYAAWLFVWHMLSGIICMVLLNASPATAATRPSIQGIRTLSSADTTRVVISLSGPITYQLIVEPSVTSSASSSSRLHIRFAPAQIAAGVRTSAKVEDGLLKEVRTGLVSDSVVRVSLEVERLGTYRATTFRSPDQIVIQLRKRQEPLAPPRLSAQPRPPVPLPKGSGERQAAAASQRRTPTAPLPPIVSEKLPPRVIASEAKQSLLEKEIASSLPAPRNDTPPSYSQTISKNQELSPTSPSSAIAPPIEPVDRQAALTPPRPLPAPLPPQRQEQPVEPEISFPRYRIMLDPGHGGSDPGAQSADGLQEKKVVLSVSKRLAQKLRARLGADVLLTRTQDVFIPLPERTAKANAAKVDLFVSIHANASPNAETHGIETYYLNNTKDRATIRLAKLENGIRVQQQLPQREDSLSYILSDLIQTGKEEESIALAQALQTALVNQVQTVVPAANDLGVKKGPFYVLVGAHMPCVLVELAFLTHVEEGQRLKSAEYQETLAEGLFHGVADFLRTGLAERDL